MIDLHAFVRIFDLSLLGGCPRCIRISGQTAALSWVGLAGIVAAGFEAICLYSSLVIACGLTALWFAHLIVRSVRNVRPDEVAMTSRRRAIRAFVSTLIGTAAMSILPETALADSGCGGWAGNSGCPPCPYPRNCHRQTPSCQCYPCSSCGSGCPGNC
jgi:hypothetical protein